QCPQHPRLLPSSGEGRGSGNTAWRSMASVQGGEDFVHGWSVGGIVGGVRQPDTAVAPNHKVAATLANVLLGIAPDGAKGEHVADVGRNRAGRQRLEPRRPAETVRPVHRTILIHEAAKQHTVAPTETAHLPCLL